MTASRGDRDLRLPRRKGRYPLLRWRYVRSGRVSGISAGRPRRALRDFRTPFGPDAPW